MKKIIALVLSVVCVMGLVGCNDSASNNQENQCSVYSFTGEKKIILSNSVIDETGGTVNVEGDLGRASGDDFIIGNKVESIDEVKENLWFELKIMTLNGEENVYQLQLELTDITS